jgi:hypothetical protein
MISMKYYLFFTSHTTWLLCSTISIVQIVFYFFCQISFRQELKDVKFDKREHCKNSPPINIESSQNSFSFFSLRLLKNCTPVIL